jgi:hypothetical protein
VNGWIIDIKGRYGRITMNGHKTLKLNINKNRGFMGAL